MLFPTLRVYRRLAPHPRSSQSSAETMDQCWEMELTVVMRLRSVWKIVNEMTC